LPGHSKYEPLAPLAAANKPVCDAEQGLRLRFDARRRSRVASQKID
jgi:hypothetical protein